MEIIRFGLRPIDC